MRRFLPHHLRGKRKVIYIPEELLKELEDIVEREKKSLSLVVYELLNCCLKQSNNSSTH